MFSVFTHPEMLQQVTAYAASNQEEEIPAELSYMVSALNSPAFSTARRRKLIDSLLAFSSLPEQALYSTTRN